MSWLTKTAEEIRFISPELNEFYALYKDSDRSFEKKLGVFDPPNFKGSVVQDLSTKSISYPFTVFFDGFDHIKDADKFFKALQNEIGTWEITHPTKGVLNLQLVSVTEKITPTSEASYTAFDTVWLEPAVLESLISADELGALTLLSVLDAIDDGINQLSQLRSDLYAAVQGALNVVNTISGLSDSILAELAATQNLINDSFNQAKNTLSSSSEKFQADPSNTELQSDLGNALVDVVSVPLEVNDNYATRIDYYNDLATELYLNAPDNSTPVDYNKALFFELGIIAILISSARIIITSDFKTRSEIISAMEKITNLFNDAISSLDQIQELFSDLDIDRQYFSNSACYTSISKVFSNTIQYLLTQFFNLKTEKRFTLKTSRSPLEITVTEYGDELLYDLFIESNQLTGNEILLLPMGKEVVIYA